MSATKTEEKKVIRFDVKDLNLQEEDPRYRYGMHCLGTYWSQATILETREQEEMIQYLRNYDYYDAIPIHKDNATSHKLYRATMQAFDASGLEGLSRPIYLILASLYMRLPREYLQLIKDRFGTIDVINYSPEYWRAIRKSAAATNAATIRNKNEEDVASGVGQQVALLDPVGHVKQSVALEEPKRPRALSDIPAIEPKRTRRAADSGGFDIDHVVAGVKSSPAIQHFADAAKPASIAAEKPRMTNSDLLEMKEDVKIAKETAMRNEAKLDGFISEMRQFMTAFANTAGIPLPIEIVDESYNDNHE